MSSSLPEIIFSENNHWRFGWGKKGLYNFDDQDLPIWVKFGPCTAEPQKFDIEMAITARKIAAAATKPIYVAMSGGMDSELIARILLQEKIPFTPLIVQYDDDYNKMDIDYAFAFCKMHNLIPEILKLDILAFFDTCVDTPYVLGNCAHILQMHIMRHAASLGGMAIIGVGEQRYKKTNNTVYLPVPQERIAVTHFMQAEKIQGVSSFYTYTPELMLSLLLEAKERGFKGMGKFAHKVKDEIYHKFWPDMPERPKYSGFEAVSDQRLRVQELLQLKYGTKLVDYSIPIFDLEHELRGTTNVFSVRY